MFTEYYKLRGEPFLLTPDQRFFYNSTVHTQAMAHLTYGLQQGEGFIVITGDVGAGKTTLVKKLCATIDPTRIIAAHVVTTLLSGHDLLRMVAAAFGLTDLPQDKGSLLLRLQAFFEAVHAEGRRAVLIVDEAQNLSQSALEELRMLSNIQVGNASPFQSFLVGQPQFRRIIANPDLEQLRQRIIASFHLGPLNVTECGEYLRHRLLQVGWDNDPKFDEEAIVAMHRHSNGIPRRLNTLANRLMLLGFLDEMHRFGADDVDRVAADLASEMEDQAVELPAIRASRIDLYEPLDTNISSRLNGVEQRLADQETFIRRAGTYILDLLKVRGLDAP